MPWDNGGLHATILERLTDGTLIRIDPQTSKGEDGRTQLSNLCKFGFKCAADYKRQTGITLSPAATQDIFWFGGVMRIDDKFPCEEVYDNFKQATVAPTPRAPASLE